MSQWLAGQVRITLYCFKCLFLHPVHQTTIQHKVSRLRHPALPPGALILTH